MPSDLRGTSLAIRGGQLVYAPGGKSIATAGRSAIKDRPRRAGRTLEPRHSAPKNGPSAPTFPIGYGISVAFSPDGKTLGIYQRHRRAITLVEAATGKEIGTLARSMERTDLWSLVFAKDGTKLYRSYDGSQTAQHGLMEWDIASRKFLRECPERQCERTPVAVA